jgi:stage II sporulation protein M
LITRIKKILLEHVKDNSNRYFLLLLAFIVGVSAGAFTVNGLSSIQRDELANFFEGFLQLLDNQKLDNMELLRVAVVDNLKIIIFLWALGVTIIGIPFIFAIIGIRGFITGFSSAFIIKAMGMKGMLFSLFALLPKEMIIIPCIIALGVNGINFSLNIIKSKSLRRISKEGLKSSFTAYCFVTLFFSSFIFAGVLIDVYIIPVFIRIIGPFIIS